jgi:hypothetical protein
MGNHEAEELLTKIVDQVVGKRKKRTFLVAQTRTRYDYRFKELCDARLLHVLKRGITARQSPGTIYTGYAIDYGCYVNFVQYEKFAALFRAEWWLRWEEVPADQFHVVQSAILDLESL